MAGARAGGRGYSCSIPFKSKPKHKLLWEKYSKHEHIHPLLIYTLCSTAPSSVAVIGTWPAPVSFQLLTVGITLESAAHRLFPLSPWQTRPTNTTPTPQIHHFTRKKRGKNKTCHFLPPSRGEATFLQNPKKDTGYSKFYDVGTHSDLLHIAPVCLQKCKKIIWNCLFQCTVRTWMLHMNLPRNNPLFFFLFKDITNIYHVLDDIVIDWNADRKVESPLFSFWFLFLTVNL